MVSSPGGQAALLVPLARALDELRQEVALSVRDVQQASGYSLSIVRDVFSGRRRVSRRAVQAVAAAMGADGEEWGRRYDAVGLPKRFTVPWSESPACAVAGCPNQPCGRYCSTHHAHNRRYGDPTAGRFSPKTHSDTCSIEGCGKPYRARGLCKSHYDQQRLSR